MSAPSQVIQDAKKNGVRMVDLKFVNIFGGWQRFSIPLRELTPAVFRDGVGFNGSHIRGWESAGDMLAIPDAASALVDPFCAVPTLSLICDIAEAGTRAPYNRDPRGIARRAEERLKRTRIADTATFGPEAEFFIFDNVQHDNTANGSFYHVDSEEGVWNSGRDEMPNLGHKIRRREGYLSAPPTDTKQDLRTEMTLLLEELGVPVESQRHEAGTAGQAGIDFRCDTLLRTADNLMLYKHVVKNIAARHGKTATFMPQPIYNDNGSGMHTRQSLWKGKKPLFSGDLYAGLSQLALHYIGGILKHAPALCALCNPTTNSYKRLVPGLEAPVNLAYSARNRSAAVRIPTFSDSPKARRIEFRTPDPSANPYLAFAALLMAGLDGIQNKIDPGEPLDNNSDDLPPEELAQAPRVPRQFGRSLGLSPGRPRFPPPR